MQPLGKKPEADFVVRLVGPRMKPWAVPMRTLAKTLEAVQRLMEPTEESGEQLDEGRLGSDSGGEPQKEPLVSLRLIDVENSSAAYRVASNDRRYVLDTLRQTRKAIDSPACAEWPWQVLSSLKDLSAIAKAMSCDIEFRAPGPPRRPYGELLATVDATTYQNVENSAFISGSTSVLGTIERVGGATEMRCGLRVPGQPRKMVFCRVTTEDLVRSLGKYMYQDVVVSGDATWARFDLRLRDLVIHSFEPPPAGTIAETFERIRALGGSAWDEIDDPESRIAEMRN